MNNIILMEKIKLDNRNQSCFIILEFKQNNRFFVTSFYPDRTYMPILIT